ncbi:MULTISPECIES: hypothetical protein [unclassified Streptomyces]|uniref:hypothetical protein n=1 Tax=unclassified Streptomyces TaxID=2593676 RepID=UPI002E7FBAC4|nr:hypothetical protein [Streptomyces sp. NBC_00562]WTC80348.1 hypothetical protein OH719_22240 [Streptomyces sp. NBC_01653]WTD35107.1 hypothetical protein OHB03_24425 [Streptomyces sp. NBC_01643]WTD90519.1 hypothetical protein OG891_24635 [Streptomyces sp. NBC_01637]WUC21493.1 hypothetical protein OHA33_23015 [Streptomyces sp. NBC_00562]
MMRQHLKLSAVLVVVVLALTGFSTSSHGGKSRGSRSHGSSSSGGGCSNSKKSNGSYHHNDYDDDIYDDSSSSSSGSSTYETATPGATATDEPGATVIRCAQPRKGKRRAVTSSTVRVSSSELGTHMYKVDVTFLDARGNTVDTGRANVELTGVDSATVSVRMDSPSKVSRVKKCRAEAELSH